MTTQKGALALSLFAVALSLAALSVSIWG